MKIFATDQAQKYFLGALVAIMFYTIVVYSIGYYAGGCHEI